MTADTDAHVIDDDAAVRDSIEFLLRSARLTVRTYDSAAAFLDALPAIRSGCIITDVRMPGISGIDLLRRLKEMRVQLPVIVITGHGDVPLAVEAMKFGAADFLEKPFDDDQLLAFVERAQAHLEAMVEATGRKASASRRIAQLSPRETEVLHALLLGDGANKSVARALDLSTRTVEMHRANIIRKMEVRSFAAAIQIAVEAGLKPQPGPPEPAIRHGRGSGG